MFKSISKKINKEILVAKVGNIAIQKSYKEYIAKTLKIYIKIKDIVVDTMLNTSIEVNVITKALANKARLTI